jgi:uridine kinase
VVAGPSGAGKSRLCHRLHARFGVPVVNLDDFYRDGDDPLLPRISLGAGHEVVDWDDPRSWSREDALDALDALCRDGAVEVPVYDLSRSRRTGIHGVELRGTSYVVAEGLFAQEVAAGLAARGVLADAVCVRNHPVRTFWRRLTRDLREHRKPPMVLVRRGWLLMRQEPRVVAHAVASGCIAMTGDEAFEHLSRVIEDG